MSACLNRGNGLAAELLKAALHAADGPEEIDGGGTGFTDDAADIGESGAELRDGGDGQVARAEGDAHGGGDADGGSATDDHGANGIGYGLVVGAVDPDLFGRQLGLVDE